MKKLYYKYRPLYEPGSSPNRKIHPFTQSIFAKAEIYYGAPADFNDPFDCNLKIHVRDSTDAEWENYLDDLIAEHPASQAQLSQVRAGKLWKTNAAIVGDIGKRQQAIHYIESSVFCLAKKGNSIPMFSYYSDGHTGIAIEFSFSDQEVPCGFSWLPSATGGVPYDGKVVFRDVEYPPTFPELNYHRLRKTDRLVRHLMFTKSQEWVHEEEFRVFRRKVPKSTIAFDRKLLTRVVFGCKSNTADVTLVKSWLKGWPSDVVFSRAEPAPDRFELIVNDFDVVKGT